MTLELIIGLIGFAFVSSITPGPNNLMLMASGANFGFRRSIPHMLGISLGHAFMVALVGFGLAQIFDQFPVLELILKIASTLYLIYLAWKIATASAPEAGATVGQPFSFLQAAAFQWVNPKAWYMAIYAVTNFTPEGQGLFPILIVAGVFASTNQPSVAVWAAIGTQIKRLLTRPKTLRAFNWTMATTLICTLIPVWFGAS